MPDHISKKLVLCSLTTDLFRNKARFNKILRKLKLKDGAVLTILDLTVMLQRTSVSNCFSYIVTSALSVITHCLIRIRSIFVFLT